ncbi:hypothetical protein [Nonomuraea sp. NPDC049758]|uniref:hypothetical protein n=1 Tax=Nonomuraea sp. NPDC049758 TaxID=3154360 RepID=UPI00343B2379
MSHPAADRRSLMHGLTLERQTVREAFTEELRYADATVFSGDTRRLLHAVEKLHRLDALDRLAGLIEPAPPPTEPHLTRPDEPVVETPPTYPPNGAEG